ncbi:site-specific integrase [Funiculus sociatus GB2-A5]|uniref:Site-specific integrase n=1 Tax=Funiculus sociatus GB2-A5 TaxID=2933946 RepID=A0ABV0JSZ1_9CYAN|nr:MULTISPECIES: site-specific integrase [unclassified Trichocoleus]MBD1903936.1 site-specific integrase [Trichocoleus sp. FACHB-832]MBD2060805.1 site-specific integrase [Trichocoleus sp. FACHB-6]
MPRIVSWDTSELILTEPLPLTLHPAAVYLSLLSPGSRLTMRQSLDAIASLLTQGQCDAMTLNWAALRYQHTAAVQGALLASRKPETVRKMMCALRRVLKEALRLDLMDATAYAKAIDLPQIRSNPELRGRALSEDEIAALFEACHNDLTPAGVRDAALIAILRVGLRRAEVVFLELKDFKASTGEVKVRGGKGGKNRTVYLPSDAIALVEDWLKVRGRSPGALLCPTWKRGRIHIRPLTPQAVLMILRKRALEAEVDLFSPHDFRRTFCSDLLDAGVDIVTVASLAGHSSPEVVAKYDRRGEETKRKAVEKLSIPSKGRTTK